MLPRSVYTRRSELQVLDVREDHEWAAGRIAGAVHIPMDQVPTRLGELDRDRPTALVCRSGNRSAQVTGYLQQVGFQAHNMTGGMQQRAAEGLPVAASGHRAVT